MHFFLIFLSALSLFLVSCGTPTDRPQDCTKSEYFDQLDQVCKTCPALLPPTCTNDCGFLIEKDDNQCPVVTCDPNCTCKDGQVLESSSDGEMCVDLF